MSLYAAAEKRSQLPPLLGLLNPFGWDMSFLGSQKTKSGIDVSPENVLSLSTFFMGKTLIAESLAQLPFAPVIREIQNGRTTTRKYKEHPSYNLISKRPHEYVSAFNFIKVMQGWACTYDNAYAIIERNNNYQPTGLFPVHPSRVTPFIDDNKLYYDIEGKRYVPWDIFHILGNTNDGITAQSRVRLGKEALGKAMAAQRFGAEYFGKGIHTSGFIKTKDYLGNDKEKAQRLKDSFLQKYGGQNGAFGVGVLEGGAEWVSNENDPEKAQLTETSKVDARVVANYLNMPVSMLNQLESGAYDREQLSIQFVNHTLIPWGRNWGQECWWKLLSKNDQQNRDIDFKFNFKGLLKGDTKARAQFYESLAKVGAYSPNHILEKENENSYPGGDLHIVSPGANTVENLNNKNNGTSNQ